MGSGLEDIVVAETTLSSVDGARGELIVAGHRIESLAGRVPFEAMVALLHQGALPDDDGVAAMQRRLGAGRRRAWETLGDTALRGATPLAADPMDHLRAGLAALAPGDDDTGLLLGAAAVLLAAWDRRRRGERPLAPDPTAPHATDLLRMLGRAASPHEARALNAYLVAVAEHGFNASTFTARVVASTGSDAISAVVAAVGALKGPLHGGAPGPVLDMLDAAGRPERAAAWVDAELRAGRRIMGIGHRVYRVRDPRAAVLETALLTLDEAAPDAGRSARLALARAVERAAIHALSLRHPDRPMYANVEFATALLLEALGLDRAVFPAVFACSRVAGWTAHVAEQQRAGRLIRPKARYVGPRPLPG